MAFPSELVDESIYILRETAAQFERPTLLFSGGKDSTILVHLALKAFYPTRFPFTLLHIDTGHNFPETLEFRDDLVQKNHLSLNVRYVEKTIQEKNLTEEKGLYASRNVLQTETLLSSLTEFKIDACIGGARRDEEKARAKERIFSFRDVDGGWKIALQRPELCYFLNGKIHTGENVRIFPLSNWTELDIWNYIEQEKITIPSIYFSHKRKVFWRDGLLWAYSDYTYMTEAEKSTVFETEVRFRTLGDMTCTAAILSNAKCVKEVIREIQSADISERGARIDDLRSDAAMEERKSKGYF